MHVVCRRYRRKVEGTYIVPAGHVPNALKPGLNSVVTVPLAFCRVAVRVAPTLFSTRPSTPTAFASSPFLMSRVVTFTPATWAPFFILPLGPSGLPPRRHSHVVGCRGMNALSRSTRGSSYFPFIRGTVRYLSFVLSVSCSLFEKSRSVLNFFVEANRDESHCISLVRGNFSALRSWDLYVGVQNS